MDGLFLTNEDAWYDASLGKLAATSSTAGLLTPPALRPDLSADYRCHSPVAESHRSDPSCVPEGSVLLDPLDVLDPLVSNTSWLEAGAGAVTCEMPEAVAAAAASALPAAPATAVTATSTASLSSRRPRRSSTSKRTAASQAPASQATRQLRHKRAASGTTTASAAPASAKRVQRAPRSRTARPTARHGKEAPAPGEVIVAPTTGKVLREHGAIWVAGCRISRTTPVKTIKELLKQADKLDPEEYRNLRRVSKNRASAQQFRWRQRDYMINLEHEHDGLVKEVDALKSQVEQLQQQQAELVAERDAMQSFLQQQQHHGA